MTAAFDANVTVDVSLAVDGSGMFTASPAWTDIAGQVRGFSWTRGRQPAAGSFPAGSGQLILDNSEGDFYRFNTASPHYPELSSGNPIRIRATHNAVTYPLIVAYADSWVSPFPTNSEELVSVPIVERLARLTRNKVTGGYTNHRTDQRIGAVLNDVGWPAADRSLDTGYTTCAVYPAQDMAAINMLRDCEFAEQGSFFQDAAGNAVFYNRVKMSGVTAAFTFGPTGADLTYVDVTTSDDDSFIFNKATIVDAHGSTHTYTDSASVTVNGPITFEAFSDVVLPNDGPDVALWVVESNKAQTERVTGFTVDPAGDPTNLWPLLGLDLCEVIRVKVSYPGSSTQLDQLVMIERITHNMDTISGGWTVTFGCSPLATIRTQDYWVLGTSALGTGTRLL